MDMNEFEGNSEIGPVQSSPEATERESAAPEKKDALHEEIRALRLQLERLHAFQPTHHPEDEDSQGELLSEQVDIDRPNRSALAKLPRWWSPSGIALASLIAAILCVGGFQLWKYVQSYQDTDDAQVDGYLDPVSSRINGTIRAVYVDNNQSVKVGQLLIQLDPRDYQVAVEQARAQLAQAQAEVNAARQQYVAAVATVRQAEAQNYLAERNAQRYTQLIKLKVVSQSEFDQYDATARAQAATVKTDEAAAASALRTIASRQAQGRGSAGRARPGRAQPELHAYHRAGGWSHRQSQRRTRSTHTARAEPDDADPGSTLGNREFQRNPTRPHASGSAGHHSR